MVHSRNGESISPYGSDFFASCGEVLRPGRGVGLFLKSDFIGFQILPAVGGRKAPKGQCMKSVLADFIADSSENNPPAGPVQRLAAAEGRVGREGF